MRPGCASAACGRMIRPVAPWEWRINNDRQKGNGMRFVVMMVLAVASGVAVADWTKVATTESDTDIYVDRATISKSGNLARMWILEDRKVADTFSGKTFLSAKLHYEYDCKDNQ